ncbi:hypothetical protein [Antrihabitans cavernicola]|uniref:DUF4185 domain-containing protein n=1 Tax=Antrihabitans cavernicola TaxID=2495913 RepID=A0A5A7S805_9NOCA|nr:hypothetical protein [Spelaeibacter cavernicola]KAA0022046.1 hypothetical protein FOY51_16865 [Spelaeibacter cavernicola]
MLRSSSFRRSFRDRGYVILLLTLLLALSGIGTASAAPGGPAKGAEIDVSNCAWPIHTDGRQSGFGFNDRFGAYSGVMMFTDLPGGHWRFSGDYPKARWMEYESYDRLVGSQDSISGQTIDADAGSSNPFAPGAAPYKPGNHYKVDLYNAPPDQRIKNAHNLFYGAWKNDPTYGKYLHSGIQSVLYRVYAAPGDVDSLGGAGRPHMSWVVDDPATSPFADSGQACASLEQAHQAYAPWPQIVTGLESINDTVIAPQIVPFAQRYLQYSVDPTSPPAINVLRPSPNGYGAPEGLWFNSRTPYVGLAPNKLVGPLLVVRFKAPTFPRIDEGKPATGNEQTQYWDWCSTQFLTPLNYTIACRHDSQFTLDKDGWATLVISTDDERPVIDGQPYKDWIPMAGNVGLSVMRQLDPNRQTFPQSPYFMPPVKIGDTNLPIDIVPGQLQQRDIKNHMGEYFPIAKYCTRAEFEKDRCATAAPRLTDGITALLPQSK